MREDEFLAQVRDLGDYQDQDEAYRVTYAVLTVLASRITASEAHDLASQIPPPLDEPLRDEDRASGEAFDLNEFYNRISERTGARPHTAERDATAVLSALSHAVSGGQIRHLISQLPDDFGPLFGKKESSRR
ncbi:DUF2267 domain-containing protein [Streptomyces sp. WMMB 322]|uniref:DUF2267 domain-containing protein n=1 Tax=Streptomyces sp. WMMB 322 TaxID=1286821 RepID=UPI0006E215E8|nr:DUF2267 domain-containing protein [Streptomyces sp. WMMB 322]SCK40721.1 Uncharacterized conserved protein, DUF2267 family [Streptomyces sp. WMMB 322]